jgi:hypothetical protein
MATPAVTTATAASSGFDTNAAPSISQPPIAMVIQSSHQRSTRRRAGCPSGNRSHADWYGNHHWMTGIRKETTAQTGLRRARMPDAAEMAAAR